MMNRLETAARQALEALEQCGQIDSYRNYELENDAITALREALAEQATEPCKNCDGMGYTDGTGDACQPCKGEGVQPQAAEPNAVLVKGFGRVALGKLNDLQGKGYAINGVSIATISETGQTVRGAVTTGGMVLWWRQQPTQQAAEPVAGMQEFLVDLDRSRTKYPSNARMFDGLIGEIDELRRAYEGDGDVRAEAFDVAVCAFRIATEGDAGGNTLYTQAPTQQAAEPVAGGLGNTAITGSNRWMMLREQVPADDQYGGAMWTPLYAHPTPTQKPLGKEERIAIIMAAESSSEAIELTEAAYGITGSKT